MVAKKHGNNLFKFKPHRTNRQRRAQAPTIMGSRKDPIHATLTLEWRGYFQTRTTRRTMSASLQTDS